MQAGSDGLNASGKELVPFPLLLPTHTKDLGTVLLIHSSKTHDVTELVSLWNDTCTF